MPIRAYLYDATGTDKAIAVTPQVVAELHDKQLLWVDVSSTDEKELTQLTSILALEHDSLFTLLQTGHRPRLDSYGA